MTNPYFTSDYQIDNRTENIVCDGCDWPATTGMNNGAAPFWYLCTCCANQARAAGRIEAKALATN